MNTRTALVTGAARRIGAEIARGLHAAGMNVIIHYHRSERDAAELRASLNSVRARSAEMICADLLDDRAYGDVIKRAVAFNGRLDVLVNNASAFYPTPLGETTIEQWDEIIGTNLKAPYFLSQQAEAALRATRGCIVNLTDIHGQQPLRHYPAYSVAKAGLAMLTRSLAKELGPDIRVNAVSPGPVLWPEDMGDEVKDRIISHTMLKRRGEPEDISKAVRFLVLEADYVTGQVLTVDGGRTLHT